MTASLYRRLTDLGSDEAVGFIVRWATSDVGRDLPPADLRTTTDLLNAGCSAERVAEMLDSLARADDAKTLVAILSPGQAHALENGTVHAERVLSVLRTAAQTPLRQRVTDLRSKRLVPGADPSEEAGGVVRLVDGEVLPDRTVRESGRARRAARYTLSDEAHAAIRVLADRWETSMSGAVERAVLDALNRG